MFAWTEKVMLHMQDKHSESFLVRLYYQKRIFMGFCCVSCEVLYLMVRTLSMHMSVA